jgi:hypothetical protein
MKKILYLAMLLSAMILMSFSCSKDEDLTTNNDNNGYLGYWFNDSTYLNGIRSSQTLFEFDFQARKLVITDLCSPLYSREYASWSISGNTLKIKGMGDYGDDSLLIVSRPSKNKLVLQWKMDNYETDKFYLRK